jgi:hypothetical protein
MAIRKDMKQPPSPWKGKLAKLAAAIVFTVIAMPAQTPPALSDEEKNVQAYVALLRSDVRKAKSQVISEVMQLDAAQAAKFWPVYQEFETEFTKTGDSVQALVKDYIANYDRMTPDVADRMANKLLDIEQQRHDLKKKYYGRFKGALDAVTATRFLQVENQLEKLIDLQLASQLPAMGQE